jgi:chaperonin GroEL (HSP60 family)
VMTHPEYIKLEKKEGARIESTEFISGVLLDKERVHQSMPRMVAKAKTLLLNFPLEMKDKEGEVRITDPGQWLGWVEQKKEWMKATIGNFRKAGVTALFNEKNIDELAQFLLVKAEMFAVRRVRKTDMEKLARATGATVLANVDEISEEHLGYAGLIEEVQVANDFMVFVRECKEPKSVSLLIRGGTKHIAEEVERALEDCLGVLSAALEDQKIVAGGGASEVEVAGRLRDYAKGFAGREQLAIRAFADALESIPMALAENAGLDQIDLLMDLVSKNEKEGSKMGLDIFDGRVKDMFAEGVIEPVRVKKHALNSASEVAIMILRIDDVIAASKISKMPPLGPPGLMPER